MKRRGPITRIRMALAVVNLDISGLAQQGGRFAGGLASEGYCGGYAQALMDVELILRGVEPNTRHYWEIREREK